MEQLLTIMKDYTAIVVACVAASVSIVSLVWSTRLNEGRDRRKVLWERELNRFSELEDTAGRLVEDLLSFNIRTEQERSEALEKLHVLRGATGRFLRYPKIAAALREINHSAGWYIAKDMKHETKTEFEEARNDVSSSFSKLIVAIDETLKNASNRL
ncbi:hypothetical protein [Methylotenera mobilis]|uniref:Uncharacterized protein n=1 Tax=Methylotenera mobilis (strain JLW8 / ATCC BAA-1282 / DSM 17540) TaxID=583345 RepID=C6WWI9_METML|nr:hypothetical protein [Methylotenera mobilis]ACT48288.1 hypothetical protein Mmol_1382 [Methylotenera mobilis JLW8]